VNFRTKQYLRKRFGDYYRASKLTLPPMLAKREWGFIFFDELPEVVMRRHKAFNSESEALEYLGSMVPAHVYHSAAYYRFPGAATMKEKQWQGADLIFDLDADHLPQKPRSYAEMLSNVKAETLKLLDFLLEDFGFSEDNMNIAFSGGRGYHIHIRDPKVQTLESPERREIVDYLSGTGLSADFFFKPVRYLKVDTGKFWKKELQSPRKVSSFEDVSEGFGWGKRIAQYLIRFLKDISTKDDTDAINEILDIIKSFRVRTVYSDTVSSDIAERIIQMKNDNRKMSLDEIAEEFGFPEDKVKNILIANGLWDFKREAISKLKLLKKIAQNQKALDMIKNGIIDFPDATYIFDAIIDKAVQDNSVHLGSAHTDEPVTADVKRLIRMASSLHGGSGMRVVPLSLALLPEFEPLNDAVVFGENEIKIEVISPLKPQNSVVEMKGKSFTVTEGINTLPEYAAVYLMCRGAAEYA
jgi:DNA primase small subunit